MRFPTLSIGCTSAFDTGLCNTFDELFLEDEEHHYQRQYGENRTGHLHRILCGVLSL